MRDRTSYAAELYRPHSAHLRELINDVSQERAGVADEVEVVSRHEAQHLLQRMIVRCAYVREAAHPLQRTVERRAGVTQIFD